MLFSNRFMPLLSSKGLQHCQVLIYIGNGGTLRIPKGLQTSLFYWVGLVEVHLETAYL